MSCSLLFRNAALVTVSDWNTYYVNQGLLTSKYLPFTCFPSEDQKQDVGVYLQAFIPKQLNQDVITILWNGALLPCYIVIILMGINHPRCQFIALCNIITLQYVTLLRLSRASNKPNQNIIHNASAQTSQNNDVF